MENYHEKLRRLMDECVHLIYSLTRSFPREELYGITSQLRRAAISVVLNYIEGFARRKGDDCKVYINFMEISFGSLKESEYLVDFCFKEGYILESEYAKIRGYFDEIGAMLYKLMRK